MQAQDFFCSSEIHLVRYPLPRLVVSGRMHIVLSVWGTTTDVRCCNISQPLIRTSQLLLRAKEKIRRSSIVYRYKRRKTVDIYTKEREGNSMPTAKAGARSQVPVPSPHPRHGGRRDWWGQARPTGRRPHPRVH